MLLEIDWINKSSSINYMAIFSFIVGVILGMVLMCLIYALLVLLSLRDKKFFVKVNPDSLTEEQAKDMILRAQEAFKDNKLRGKQTKGTYFRRLSTDLVYGIASSFYPDSKYPLLEITVDEGIELIGYIKVRLDEILNKKVLKIARRFKVSDIVKISLNTHNVVDSKAFQATKSVAKTASKIKKVLDVVNPVNWFKRLVVDRAISVITNKLCLITLAIIGEEAFKIYSKSVLKKQVEIETNVDELADSIESDIKEIVEESNEKKTESKTDYKIKFKTKSCRLPRRELNYASSYDLNYGFLTRKNVEEENEKEEQN